MGTLRASVEQVVYTVLRDIGVPESEMAHDAILLDIMLDEDATCWFVPAVERLLTTKVPLQNWEYVITVGDTVDMLEQHLSQSAAFQGPQPNLRSKRT